MKKILSLMFTALLALSVAAQESMPASLYKLLTAGNIINRCYVDSVDDTKVVEEGIKAMLKQLDPHSTYTDPKETKALLEEMEGCFGGIGIQFNIVDDTLYVIRTTTAGPSERAGILAGDRVVMVNDTVIAGVKMEREDIMSRLRGPVDTKVKLSVKRTGIERMLTFDIVRSMISTESVDAVYMVDKSVGYIRITSFGTCEQRRKEIAIRKVNGATIKDILVRFFREYILLLGIAALIAFPIGYVVMKQWLENYNRQTEIGILPFISIFGGIILVMVISIGYRVWKAANENPADIVKSE